MPIVKRKQIEAWNVESLVIGVEELSHVRVLGEVVRPTGGGWVLAQADTLPNAAAAGVVSLIQPDYFEVTVSGVIEGLAGLTAGQISYLDPSTAGAVTTTDPGDSDLISRPVWHALDATTALFLPHRAAVPAGAGLDIPALDPATLPLNSADQIVLDQGAGNRRTTINELRVLFSIFWIATGAMLSGAHSAEYPSAYEEVIDTVPT